MRIAVVRPFPTVLSDTGYNVQEFGLGRALANQGINVDIYCAGHAQKAEISEYYRSGDQVVRIFRLPCKTILFNHGIFKKLFAYLKKTPYDIIQTQGYEQITSFFLAVFAARRGIPLIVHEGLYENDYGRVINSLLKLFHLTLGRYIRYYSSQTIAKTEMARSLAAQKGFKNLCTLPIGLDLEKFSDAQAIDWRTELGLEPESALLLYVGIIEPRRNVDFLIQLIHAVSKRVQKPVYLLIVGAGPKEAACKQLAADLGVSDQVLFLGKRDQSELPSLYRQADLFLLASDYEIVGMVLLESLYFCLPVVSTRTAGGMDIVCDRCGRLFKRKDIRQWSDFIVSYLSDPAPYGFKAYLQKAPFNRSWAWVGKRYADLYHQITRQREKQAQ